MRQFINIASLFLVLSTACFAQSKAESIEKLRNKYQREGFRRFDIKPDIPVDKIKNLLDEDGKFQDLRSEQEGLIKSEAIKSRYSEPQTKVSNFNDKAMMRLWALADSYRGKNLNSTDFESIRSKFWKSVVNYSHMETDRLNGGGGRFHSSCFLLPRTAINIYFIFLPEMNDIEAGKNNDPLMKEANEQLRQLALQAWTQPYRNDETDKDPFSVERFRKHVWWVGGNALGYRALLPSAVLVKGEKMIDTLVEVAQNGIGQVSQNTYDTAFWTEGITADGGGWGHGMQCLIWGYPTDGTNGSLSILKDLSGTQWERPLLERNKAALFNYFRGASFYYYKGFIPPCTGRTSMNYYQEKAADISYGRLVDRLISEFASSFTSEELKELKQLSQEVKQRNILMKGYPDGYYQESRYYFNNDNLIKKNADYMVLVDMASNRVDGLESAHTMADAINFFTCDGLTFFQRTGEEYLKAIGGWTITALPGITARQLKNNELNPITNWRGFCSKFNFAAGATRGGENAVGGFIFEKMNGENKKEDQTLKQGGSTGDTKNPLIYGVQAHKGYFMIEDYTICLGAGINNLIKESEHPIYTTVEQTFRFEEVNILQGKEKEKIETIQNESRTFDLSKQPLWIGQLSGFSYVVLPEPSTQVIVKAETRKTDWVFKNPMNKRSNPPAEGNILQISINHGANPQNARYAYAVYCGKKTFEEIAEKDLPFQILTNEPSLQAVQSKNGKILQGLFFSKEAKLKTNKQIIEVSAPCALMIEEVKEGVRITVCDAEMNKSLKSIEVTLNSEFKGEGVTSQKGRSVVSIPMESGDQLGRPVSVLVKRK